MKIGGYGFVCEQRCCTVVNEAEEKKKITPCRIWHDTHDASTAAHPHKQRWGHEVRDLLLFFFFCVHSCLLSTTSKIWHCVAWYSYFFCVLTAKLTLQRTQETTRNKHNSGKIISASAMLKVLLYFSWYFAQNFPQIFSGDKHLGPTTYYTRRASLSSFCSSTLLDGHHMMWVGLCFSE